VAVTFYFDNIVFFSTMTLRLKPTIRLLLEETGGWHHG